MPSPFPGMNPYLENPQLWSEFHNRLIVAIAIAIEPELNLNYRVAVEKRIYLSTSSDLVGIPDISIVSKQPTPTPPTSPVTLLTRIEPIPVQLPLPETVEESYLEIREMPSDRVITVIEVLSPKNKAAGVGRSTYDTKRQQVLGSRTNLVEIDLLRGGKPMPILGVRQRSDYRILVSRGSQLPQAQLYAFSVRDAIPCLSVPLQPQETEPSLDLQNLSIAVYNQARFDLAIDYRQEPYHPLKAADREWVDNLLREQGLR
ncbi:DUF4058 family protein [Planktothrix sp. FACHB-1355]|uniref:DUF4058 family protein n=1 Tax=Aerosakkonema funiforme FACHB-1375 TaxID=2949571 RepID=A0A926ZF92_9CYAN|nr:MULTISPECIES: DUF4058 family protein [Oscillatoriales]MBD2179827.1 DUF4058 family protein [Aerosakkonema funiforme FACHB-1375]MBD3562254.1 DUF4058 family protein [Planktothrix sp. FACHB-1355]